MWSTWVITLLFTHHAYTHSHPITFSLSSFLHPFLTKPHHLILQFHFYIHLYNHTHFLTPLSAIPRHISPLHVLIWLQLQNLFLSLDFHIVLTTTSILTFFQLSCLVPTNPFIPVSYVLSWIDFFFVICWSYPCKTWAKAKWAESYC